MAEAEIKAYIKDSQLRGHVYPTICEEALEIQKKYNLTDVQLNIYNYLCRGDFVLRNGDADMFFNPESNGIGWHHSRDWSYGQLSKLIKAGIIKIEKVHDCRDGKYTSWYFYLSRYDRKNLFDGGCFVTSSSVFNVKRSTGLLDGWYSSGKYESINLKSKIDKEGFIYFNYKGIEFPKSKGDPSHLIRELNQRIKAVDEPYPLSTKQLVWLELQLKSEDFIKYNYVNFLNIMESKEGIDTHDREYASLEIALEKVANDHLKGCI